MTDRAPDPEVTALIRRYSATWTALRRHDEGVPSPAAQPQATAHPQAQPDAEGALQQRLMAVARQAQDNGEDIVAALRREIGLEPRQAVGIPDGLPADMIEALREAVAVEPEPDGLDHLLEGDAGEWTPAGERLLREAVAVGAAANNPVAMLASMHGGLSPEGDRLFQDIMDDITGSEEPAP